MSKCDLAHLLYCFEMSKEYIKKESKTNLNKKPNINPKGKIAIHTNHECNAHFLPIFFENAGEGVEEVG